MCNKNRAKEYYKNNRDVILNRSKEYYINNKESILEHLKNKYQSLTEDSQLGYLWLPTPHCAVLV